MAPASRDVCLVVPCFDEAHRLEPDTWLAAVERWAWLSLHFVDDGSADGTLTVLQQLAAAAPEGRVQVQSLPSNHGKGEAVRAGLLAVLAQGPPPVVGFWDADLSTPLDALPLLGRALDADPRREIVMGARVKLLGMHIERRGHRHYGGRIIATLISLALAIPVYDTQCGAKLLAVTADLPAMLQQPFLSRWLFDVELLARWQQRRPPGAWRHGLCEVPLPRWTHAAGSKVHPLDALVAPLAVLRIRQHYRRTKGSGR